MLFFIGRGFMQIAADLLFFTEVDYAGFALGIEAISLQRSEEIKLKARPKATPK